MIPGYKPFLLGKEKTKNKTPKEKQMPTTKHRIQRHDVHVATYVYETKNYDLFVLHECNRDIRPAKVLEESMIEHGFLDSGAIHVSLMKDGKLKVIRGHHRFVHAQKLHLPVKFIIDDDIQIFDLEADTRSAWNQNDFLVGWAKADKDDYKAVMEFAATHGYSASLAAGILANNYCGTGNIANAIKQGRYKITEVKNARKVAMVTDHMRGCGVEHATNSALVMALAVICLAPEFDEHKLMRRISSNPSVLKKCGTKKEYMQEIERVYNTHTSADNKIPLSLIAEKISVSRRATHK